MGRSKHQKGTDKKVDKLTVKDLRKLLNPERNMAIMMDTQRGFGVMVATQDAMQSLIQMMRDSGVSPELLESKDGRPTSNPATPPRPLSPTITDEDTDVIEQKTVGDLKREVGEAGMLMLLAPAAKGEGYHLVLSAAGDKAEVILTLMVIHGLIPKSPISDMATSEIKA